MSDKGQTAYHEAGHVIACEEFGVLYLCELKTYRALTRAEQLLDGGADPLRALIGAAQVEGVLAPELALVLLRKVIAVRRAREALAADKQIDAARLYEIAAESGAKVERPAL